MKNTALMVLPASRRICTGSIDGYDDIKELLGDDAQPEANTLCKIEGNIYLQVWVDCNRFGIDIMWRSTLQREMIMHGPTIITAYDLSTGESVDCPLSAQEFGQTIEWETADQIFTRMIPAD